MGENKPTTRTLPDGVTKVTHYPSGEQVMQPSNVMSEGLQQEEPNAIRRWLDAEKTHRRLTAVEEKRAAQRGGRPVPSDKSPL